MSTNPNSPTTAAEAALVKSDGASPRPKRFRARSNYFVKNDLVWVRLPKLPYWPAEVLSSDERYNRVRARLLCPPKAELLAANLKEEERIWAQAKQRHVKELQAKRQREEATRAGKTQCQQQQGDGAAADDADDEKFVVPDLEADVVTAHGNVVYFFDKLATAEELQECIEERLKRSAHDVSAYEADFMKAVMQANRLVRTVLSPEKLQPYTICGVGVVHSLMRHHISAPRQPHTGTFEPQTAVIRVRRGLENGLLHLAGFEYIWVLFQFSYAAAFATGEGQAYVKELQAVEGCGTGDGSKSSSPLVGEGGEAPASVKGGKETAHPWTNRQGITHSQGYKTLLVPPRDEEIRGVFATRSPHRPNFIGLSCVRLVRVQGRDVHIADHDLLHGTPVLDIKPYLPFCDAHPDAHAGWVEELDNAGRGKGDHKVNEQVRQVDRIFATGVVDGQQGTEES